MEQQTAVDWIIKEIETLITIETFNKWKDIKDKAKKMEKDQFIQCAKYSFNAGMKPLSEPDHAEPFARHFYKQKYGDSN